MPGQDPFIQRPEARSASALTVARRVFLEERGRF
jgi:hypothetical protein